MLFSNNIAKNPVHFILCRVFIPTKQDQVFRANRPTPPSVKKPAFGNPKQFIHKIQKHAFKITPVSKQISS